MTSDDTIRDLLSRIWGETLRGDELPSQTLRPMAQPSRTEPLRAGATVSIRLPPDIETVPRERPAAGEGGASGPDDAAGFHVLRTLGRGGMGVVYAARQHSLAREVALKMPLGDLSGDGGGEARFVSEALVTGDLDHPNIVPVHDLGRDEAGRLYMAMKLVRGTPWKRLLHPREDHPEEVARAARLGLRDHLEVLLKVADAVAFSHSRDVVHRDLKPENVMVGEYGEVLVMDWGLALDVSPSGRAVRKAPHRSEARGSAGTPSYMSPELALADYERIGVASDVYLLGAILYELLTGAPPHRGGDVFEVLAAAARGEIEPPERRAPGARVPRELSRITLRALAPDPAERFHGVPALQGALRDYLAHEESLSLAEEAGRQIERLALPGEVAREARYALYADALAGFAQALQQWPQNEAARAARVRAALDYADEALDRGDVGLARAQLPQVEADGHVEPARTAALRAAVTARSVSRLRSRVGAAAVVALLAAAAWGIRTAEQGLQARRTAERQEQVVASHLREAWSAARAGDVAAVSAARVSLASADGPGRDEGLARVDWAREVLLWRRGRWAELAEPLAPAGVEWRERVPALDRRRSPRPVDPCARLLGRAEGTPSELAGWIAEPCRGGDLPLLFGRLREAARHGVSAETLDAARRELIAADAEARGRRARPSRRDALRFRLRLAGLFAPAVEAALRRGGASHAVRYERLLVPFRLAEAPVGEPRVPSLEPPRMVTRGDGVWAAIDAASGRELWRTSLAFPDPGGTAVPVEDGSVVVAAGSQVVRLDGETGRVLGRAVLDGAVILAWPEPDDRATLVLLLSGEEWKGTVREVRLRHGALTPPVAEAGDVASLFPTRSGAEALRDRLRRAAEDELGEGDGGVPARVLAGLRAAAARDPGNPDLWLAAMQETGADAALREELARAVAAARVSGPSDAVRLGIALERAGFRALGQRLYERAAERFLDLHGNPDLATQSAPALQLRALGGELFESGDTARAFELVELGRRFATFVEDDARFYRRYAHWLRERGRTDEAAVMAGRALEAQSGGAGTLLLSAGMIAAVDAAIGLLPVATLLLAVVLLRAWLGSRAARHADLYARGWRRAGQRWSAFVTQSVERLGCVFLAYTPRFERVVVALLALAVLAAAAVLVGGLRAAHASSANPFAWSAGYLSGAETVRYLEAAGPSPAALRLLAEARRARREVEAAREALVAALREAGADPLALNNLGVLEEEAGREGEARRRYAAAAALSGDGARVAHWNLARLDGDPERAAVRGGELAHRDRLRAEREGPARPLWAACPASDLRVVEAQSRPLARSTADAVIEILSLRFGDLLDRTFMTAGVL